MLYPGITSCCLNLKKKNTTISITQIGIHYSDNQRRQAANTTTSSLKENKENTQQGRIQMQTLQTAKTMNMMSSDDDELGPSHHKGESPFCLSNLRGRSEAGTVAQDHIRGD